MEGWEHRGVWLLANENFRISLLRNQRFFYLFANLQIVPSAGGDLCMASISLLREMPALLFQPPYEDPLKVESTGPASCPKALSSKLEVP